MSLSMYQASVPVLIRGLNNLRNILQKAAAHAEAKKIDQVAFLQARFYPDMFTMARQVQIATDMAKSCPSRLAGLEPPKYEDTETSFAELQARIDKTIAHLKSFKPEQIDGSEDRDVTLATPRGPLNFKGAPYLLGFLLPNFYFHVTTAYALLRHNGVELGKMDYIGQA
jgi:hypothetical protein